MNTTSAFLSQRRTTTSELSSAPTATQNTAQPTSPTTMNKNGTARVGREETKAIVQGIARELKSGDKSIVKILREAGL
jgi:hypothetical protein